jgi:hypothetical protein
MSAPLETAEFQNLYVGNPHDDDGQVIDSLVQEVDTPADVTRVTQPISVRQLDKPAPRGRIITGNIVLTTTFTPIQVLPADANRKSVTLQALSTAASPTALVEYISIADTSGKVNTTSALNLRHGKDPMTLNDYTGPVWAVVGPSSTAGIELSWVAVTR